MTKLCRAVTITVFGLLCLSPASDHVNGSTSSGLLLAQTTCGSGWDLRAAKASDSKVKVDLSLSTTKDGQKLLRWSPSTDLIKLSIFPAQGPANAKGEIETCVPGLEVFSFKVPNSISLRDLKEAQKLKPGYYAIRVTLLTDWYVNNQRIEAGTSDWIVIQIE